MSTTAQRQERQPSDEWELVAADDMHAADALKQEGNALFQQRKFLDAVQVYGRALALLPNDLRHFSTDDVKSLAELEIAVRLNRAFAYLQLEDATLLAYAEQDCSHVLANKADCVKGYYRRALVRERLGNIKDALFDAESMLLLEPANPAALQLKARLQKSCVVNATPSHTVNGSLDIALNQRCVISNEGSSTPKVGTEGGSALEAWQSLQDEERRLRNEYTCQAKLKKTRRPGKQTAYAVEKSRTKLDSSKTGRNAAQSEGEVRSKTELDWASLLEEEASTVAITYNKRARSSAKQKTQGMNKTGCAASSLPSR